ncbi:MAG: YfiR family protein [Rhodocyclaceae bacterium]|nr:YfiR family protein [Rhodocyclaceae bacterium]
MNHLRMLARPRTSRHRLRCIALAALVAVPAWALGDAPSREDQIKAALVYKIAKFIEWPADAVRDGVLVFCAFGDSPVVAALAAIEGRAVRAYRAKFSRLEAPAGAVAGGCHVLYLATGAVRDRTPVAHGGRAILTVGDSEDFAVRGGMVGLVSSGNRVSFEINLRAARAAGIRIAAPLLELADVVE